MTPENASLRVRAWFRADLLRRLDSPTAEPSKPLRLIAPAPASRPVNERTRESLRAPRQPQQRRTYTERACRSDLTFEHVMRCLRAHESFRIIAQGRQVTVSAIGRCIDRGMRKNPRLASEYLEMRACGCGQPKNVSAPVCRFCGADARKAAAKNDKRTL